MKPTCILAMPSSGSDWFAECYRRALGLNYFHKEFFNPMCNADCPKGFGSECVSNYKHIATPEPEQNAMRTFLNSGYTLNKEVFCAFNVEWFADRFDCITLFRSTESTFPPGRLRVYQWYDAVWNSLNDAGHRLSQSTVRGRAVEAHTVMLKQLLESSKRCEIPIISYDEIASCEPCNVKRALKTAWFTADIVVETRLCKTKKVE
jgi:hypothetical protein